MNYLELLITFLLIIPIVTFLLVQDLALNLVFIFIFFGTLLSVNIGFTLKAAQLFALFAILNQIILFFRGKKDFNKLTFSTLYPFILFFLSMLISLCSIPIFSAFYENVSGLRFIFNYLFLQLICFTIAIGITSKEKLKKAFTFTFISYLLVLAFGFFQQIGFYLGFYDPLMYLGKHSIFVDFYGPFLRISPGTFANEFGEITQSILITITTFLIILKEELSFKNKLFLKTSFVLAFIAFIINFTRISWFVYVGYLVLLFFIMKPSFNNTIKILSATSIILLGIYFINLETNILSLIPIIDRLNELSDISESSAGLRVESWKESYQLFLDSPYLGNGIGTTIDTHNVPLELLSETGVIGFITFYLLVSILLVKFWNMYKVTTDKYLKASSLSIFFVFLGCIFFDFTNHGIYHFILWLTIGLGLATESIIKQNSLGIKK